MSTLTDFAENVCAIKLCRQTAGAYTPAATVYVGMCSSNPGETATGANCNELPNSYSYARQAITFLAAASRRVTQTGLISFPLITGALGTATHYVIVDALAYGTGNVIGYGPLTESKQFVNGSTPTIASGEIYAQFTPQSGFGLNTYAAEGLLNWLFRNVTFPIPATYLGASLAVLTDASLGSAISEPPSARAYARVLLNPPNGSSPAWASVSGNEISNANMWQFPLPTYDDIPPPGWGNVKATFIADADTNGNILMYDCGIPDQDIGTGDPLRYPIAGFKLRIN